MPRVTAILLSWKRQLNMDAIVQALRAQSVPVEVWLINNFDMAVYGADRTVHIPWNAGEWARYPFAARAETEYVMFQDDDFMLGDSDFLADAIRIHDEKCPDGILGVAGRRLQETAPHYWPDILDGPADILKGHFQLFRPQVAKRARLSSHPSASDIFWSLDIGGGWVSKELARRLVTLPRHGVGYEFRPEHYTEREEACAEWLASR